MPQRTLRMNNDGLHLTVSAGTGIAVWFAKYSAVLLPVLWIAYVSILIAIKLPELYEKNPWFRRGCDWLVNRFRRSRHGS